MKNYKASEELAQILIKNGFVEITKSKHPNHFKLLNENGYDPHKMKRRFAVSANKKTYVEFDYLEILAKHNEDLHRHNRKTELTIDEVKSIITFYNLPVQTQSAVKRNGLEILNLHESYKYYIQHPDFAKARLGRLKLIDIFESIKI